MRDELVEWAVVAAVLVLLYCTGALIAGLAAILAVLALPAWIGFLIDLSRYRRGVFRGARVLVCGASGGIGAEIALELARCGAHVVLAARSAEQLEEVAEAARKVGAASAHTLASDLSSHAACRDAVQRAGLLLGGRLDVLVLSHELAFHGRFGADEDGRYTMLERVVAVNACSHAYLALFALPLLRSSALGGRILVVSSIAAKLAQSGAAPYAAAKQAQHGFFQYMRQDALDSRLSITLGVLGSLAHASDAFSTELDQSRGASPPDAAVALVRGLAARRREVHFPATLCVAGPLRALFPATVDAFVRVWMRRTAETGAGATVY